MISHARKLESSSHAYHCSSNLHSKTINTVNEYAMVRQCRSSLISHRVLRWLSLMWIFRFQGLQSPQPLGIQQKLLQFFHSAGPHKTSMELRKLCFIAHCSRDTSLPGGAVLKDVEMCSTSFVGGMFPSSPSTLFGSQYYDDLSLGSIRVKSERTCSNSPRQSLNITLLSLSCKTQ